MFCFGVDFTNVFANKTDTGHLKATDNPDGAGKKGPAAYGFAGEIADKTINKNDKADEEYYKT